MHRDLLGFGDRSASFLLMRGNRRRTGIGHNITADIRPSKDWIQANHRHARDRQRLAKVVVVKSVENSCELSSLVSRWKLLARGLALLTGLWTNHSPLSPLLRGSLSPTVRWAISFLIRAMPAPIPSARSNSSRRRSKRSASPIRSSLIPKAESSPAMAGFRPPRRWGLPRCRRSPCPACRRPRSGRCGSPTTRSRSMPAGTSKSCRQELGELASIDVDIDPTLTGFSTGEIDVIPRQDSPIPTTRSSRRFRRRRTRAR